MPFALLLLIISFDLLVLLALVLSLITCNRSLLILRTAVLSLFLSNSAELATRELNFWVLVKQILKVGLGAELLLLADESLSFPTLLEALWLDYASEESPLTGTKSCRID